MPSPLEFEGDKTGGLDIAEVRKAEASMPKKALLEGVGHTHILQVFKSHWETGAISVQHSGADLSQDDRDLADIFYDEVYAIGFDNKICSSE